MAQEQKPQHKIPMGREVWAALPRIARLNSVDVLWVSTAMAGNGVTRLMIDGFFPETRAIEGVRAIVTISAIAFMANSVKQINALVPAPLYPKKNKQPRIIGQPYNETVAQVQSLTLWSLGASGSEAFARLSWGAYGVINNPYILGFAAAATALTLAGAAMVFRARSRIKKSFQSKLILH